MSNRIIIEEIEPQATETTLSFEAYYRSFNNLATVHNLGLSPEMHSIRCMLLSLRDTKCPFPFLVSFTIMARNRENKGHEVSS